MKIIYAIASMLMLVFLQAAYADPQWNATINLYNIAANSDASLKGSVTFKIASRAQDYYPTLHWDDWTLIDGNPFTLNANQSYQQVIRQFGPDRLYQVGVIDVNANGVTLQCTPDIKSSEDTPNMTVTNDYYHQLSVVVEWYKDSASTAPQARCFWIGNYYINQ